MPRQVLRLRMQQAAAPALAVQPSLAAHSKGVPSVCAPYCHWVPGEMEGATGMQWPCAYPGDHDDHEVLMSDIVVLQSGVVLQDLHSQAKNVRLLSQDGCEAPKKCLHEGAPCPGR